MRGRNLWCGVIVLIAATAMGQSKIRVSDLAWMAGTWNGAVGGAQVERTCAQPVGGSMICMMRVIASEKVVWMEFSVLRETADGIVLDTRFFMPDLQPGPPVSSELRLKSATASEAVFENPNGTQPKMESITLLGPDEMNSHADLVDEQGKASAIDARWKRVQQAAKVPQGSSPLKNAQ